MFIIGHIDKQLNIGQNFRYVLKATKNDSDNGKDDRQA